MNRSLTEFDKSLYEWQMWSPGFGEEGQRKLKNASVLVSRCGGLGGVVALELAAAGVGRLVLAHPGDVRPADLNRQLLMTRDWIGKPGVESAKRRLLDLNPDVEIEAVNAAIDEKNARDLVSKVDLVVDCAPLFEERYLMNREAVAQGKPLVDCAMHDMAVQITTVIPGKTPCLACLFPEKPPGWKREFPVFGAVSGMVACLGAMEAIKVLSGVGEPLLNALVVADLRDMSFQRVVTKRNTSCKVCGR